MAPDFANSAICQLPPLKDATVNVRYGGVLRMHCCGNV